MYIISTDGTAVTVAVEMDVTLVTAACPWGISNHGGGRQRGKIQKKEKKIQTMYLRFVMKVPQETDSRGWMKYRRGLECI